MSLLGWCLYRGLPTAVIMSLLGWCLSNNYTRTWRVLSSCHCWGDACTGACRLLSSCHCWGDACTGACGLLSSCHCWGDACQIISQGPADCCPHACIVQTPSWEWSTLGEGWRAVRPQDVLLINNLPSASSGVTRRCLPTSSVTWEAYITVSVRSCACR